MDQNTGLSKGRSIDSNSKERTGEDLDVDLDGGSLVVRTGEDLDEI